MVTLDTEEITEEEGALISAAFYDEIERIVGEAINAIDTGDAVTATDAIRVVQLNASSSDLLDNDDGIEAILSHVRNPDGLANTSLSETGQQLVALSCLLHNAIVALKRHQAFRRLPNG